MSEESTADCLATTRVPGRLTMTTEDIAALLGKTSSAVNRQRHDIRQGKASPDALPRALDIPGTRKTLWLTEDVVGWLRRHREEQISAPEITTTQPPKRPCGRPRKREQLARLNSSSIASNRMGDA